MSEGSSLLSIRLAEDLRARLDQAAKATRRSRGSIVKDALSRHLDAMILEETADARNARRARILSYAGAGAKLHGGRTAAEIDAATGAFRGDE